VSKALSLAYGNEIPVGGGDTRLFENQWALEFHLDGAPGFHADILAARE